MNQKGEVKYTVGNEDADDNEKTTKEKETDKKDN